MAIARRLVIIGGPNGCGKSTIASAPRASELLGDAPVINPDEYTRKFIAEAKLDRTAANLAAVIQAELDVWKAIAEDKSIAVETVLSTEKFLPAVYAARARKFAVKLVFISLPTVTISIERVATRVRSGGHDVPEAKIRERWTRSHDRFIDFMALSDEVALFSNAAGSPVLVGSKETNGRFALLSKSELPEITRRLSL